MNAFQYRAERYDGAAAVGMIDAANLADAEAQLMTMGLRIFELAPAIKPVKPVRLGPADLRTFNELLMQISRSGVPVERGLAMLSADMRTSKLKTAIDALVADLESGTPIETAIANRRGSFPPLYGRLIDAGIQSADLPAVLQQFSRHTDDMTELRDGLWRACLYPAIVFASLLFLLTFLGYWLLPTYFASLEKIAFSTYDWRTGTRDTIRIKLSPIAVAVLYLGKIAPLLLAILVAGVIAAWLAVRAARMGRGNDHWLDRIVLPLPLIGRAVRDSYLASWLDVMSIGVGSGLDLPRAIALAGDATSLPSLRTDGDAIRTRIEAGQPAAGAALTRLPATVPMAIDMAMAQGQLPQSFAVMAEQYRGQAERQTRMIPGRIVPVLLIAIGLLAGGIMYSLWVPMAQMIRMMTGGGSF